MSRALTRWALAATVAGLAFAAQPAWADGGFLSVDTGSGWTHDATQPLFDFSHLAPGRSDAADVRLRNDGTVTSTLTISAHDIVDAENGCAHSELLVDTTCGDGDTGELGHELELSIYSTAAPTTPVWQGTVYDLAQPVVLDDADAAGHVDAYRIEASLPRSSGNETQTDTVRFGVQLALTANGTTSTVAVEGVKVTRPTSGSLVHRLLPFTGAPVGWIVGGGMALLGLGAGLLRTSTSGRRR
jgi:hypothetical protein